MENAALVMKVGQRAGGGNFGARYKAPFVGLNG
jgi:hypothetical protein